MLHYIIQTIAFQLFFLLVYDVFLKKETFFNWNRMYLLSTAVLSLTLPFIKIDSFKQVVPQDYIVFLPEIMLGQSSENLNNTVVLDAVILENNPLSFWEILFYVGVIVAFCLFLIKVIKILILVIKNPKQSIGKVVLVELLNSTAAFSFFHYIFLGEHIKTEDKDTILKHELIHTEQKHTIDLLFFEVLRIVFWFNPFVYMYQNRLATLHEFIADANALKHQGKEQYYQNLLSQVFDTKNISFINTFFNQSLIKKRIVMLSKTKSKQIHLLKYALLIPMVLGMLVYTSTEAQENNKENIDLSQYSFTLEEGEKLVGKKKKIHEKYESFLKSNKDYVSWIYIDGKNNKKNFSVHHVSEKVPEGFSKSKMFFRDGTSCVSYFKDEAPSPVMLSVKEIKKKGEELLKSKEEYAIEVPFSVIENVPDYPGCEDLTSNAEKRDCMSEKIREFVAKKFNTKLANDLSLTGRQRINVIFKINEAGIISTDDIRARAPHIDLEEEAIRVISLLPKMKPGLQKGKAVAVPYSLPIIFQVDDDVKTKEPELIPLNEANIDVPFSVIDQVPIFPGCEDLTKEEQKKCISDNIKKHVNRNFNTSLADSLGLTGRQRINVIFKIDTLGNIVGVRSRAPHPGLEEEAARVINLLPKMIPGKQRGKAVTVPYSLPIVFQIQDDSVVDETEIIANRENMKKDIFGEDIDVPFNVIEEVPVYPGCEDLKSNAEKKDCMSKNISEFVAKNFNIKVANKNGLSGRQRINVIFKISSEGNVTGIRSRAPHPELEKEAIRVISLLPKMKPGVQRGKVVSVPYSLPIIFEVPEQTKMLNEVSITETSSKPNENINVPFSVVDQVPVFPGCEDLDKEEQKNCTSKGIKDFVNKKFNAKLAKKLGLIGQQRINVIFKIDKQGDIIDVRSRASHPELEKEAARVIKKLPKMIPGKQRGKKVTVPYSLPIIFQAQK